jgi:hypothetical protein
MRDLFAHTSAHWGRYSEYKWKTAPDGNCYLLPTEKAKPSVYDPMKDPHTLVIDALEIGMMLFRREQESKMKQAIRAFAGKYGLLGIMTALPTTAEFIEYEKVYLPKNPFLRKETMETSEYVRLFFPFIQPDFRKKGVESVWQTEDKYEIAFAMTFQSDPQAKAMSFMRNYGERYDWLCKLFKDWAFLALTTRFYMDDKKRDDPDTLALYRKGIAAFEGNAPTYHIELRGKPTLVWDFHSLLLDIRFLLTVMLTDDQTPLRMCRHCFKPFIAKQPDEDYCCEECSKARETRT